MPPTPRRTKPAPPAAVDPKPGRPHPDNRAEFLASRSPSQLATILQRRPDARWGAPLTGLADLAARLGLPASTQRAMLDLPMPGHQLLHAAVAAGGSPTVDRLLDVLAPSPGSPAELAAAVGQVVDDLQQHALLWRRDDGTLHVDAAVTDLIDRPMNLGSTVRTHLGRASRHDLERMCATWQLPPRGTIEANRARLASVLTDPERVRQAVDRAPAAARALLADLAGAQVDRQRVSDRAGTREGENWARQRGLLFGGEYYLPPELPVEVLLAIRHGAVRIPFNPHPPGELTTPVAADTLPSGAAAAAGDVTQSVAALIDRLGRTPAAALKAGGIGSREVTKIAKALTVDDAHVRFGLELLRDLGLLAGRGAAVGIAPDAASWRALDPGDRYADLATVWFGLPIHPTVDRDDEGKAISAVGRRTVIGSAEQLRAEALELVAGLPDGLGVSGADTLDVWVSWHRLVLPVEPDDVAAIWREAHLLGVLVGGALSPLGRALLDGDSAGLQQAAGALLEPSASAGRFGSDLTVMVAGSPSATVSRLLDTCADREGRGAAVVWRFSPASVRRAFDEGWTADELLAALRAVADADLPQPLTYLVADVARRHGHLVVLPAACCVRSADAALLAEVVAHRSLRKLRPCLVTAEVATFQDSPATVVAALRGAGYLPVAADEGGVVDLHREPDRPDSPRSGRDGRRAADRLGDRRHPAHQAEAADEAFAAGLLRSVGPPTGPTGPTAASLETFAEQLDDVERHQLAWAIDQASPVTITYHAATGGVTTRTISELELIGDQIYAWCHLREDERVFSIGRIVAVVPVGA